MALPHSGKAGWKVGPEYLSQTLYGDPAFSSNTMHDHPIWTQLMFRTSRVSESPMNTLVAQSPSAVPVDDVDEGSTVSGQISRETDTRWYDGYCNDTG